SDYGCATKSRRSRRSALRKTATIEMFLNYRVSSRVGARHPGHSLRSWGRLSSGRTEVGKSPYSLRITTIPPEGRAPTIEPEHRTLVGGDSGQGCAILLLEPGAQLPCGGHVVDAPYPMASGPQVFPHFDVVGDVNFFRLGEGGQIEAVAQDAGGQEIGMYSG